MDRVKDIEMRILEELVREFSIGLLREGLFRLDMVGWSYRELEKGVWLRG